MENPSFVLFIVLVTSAALLHVGDSVSCSPNYNCRLPACRCWDDPSRPGNFSDDGTPQIVMLAFSFAINNHTLNQFMPLFSQLVNPNDCPVRGTFFSQFTNTDVSSLRKLHEDGHELGLTSSDGSIPHSRREWVESLFQSSEKLYDAGVSRDKIKGARSPNLYMGGNDEIQAEMQFGMEYEASCVFSFSNSLAGNNHKKGDAQTPWPYTYDFVKGTPSCDMGNTPNMTFPGVWQFLVPEMTFRDHNCATLSSCSPFLNTTADAFTFLYNSFQHHYYKGRAPMVLYIDPLWMSRKLQVEGLLQFLQVIGRFPDTWMVTMTQALQWVKYPVPMYKTVKFMPWECSQQEKRRGRNIRR